MSAIRDRIRKKEDNVGRCEKCEIYWLPLENYVMKRSGKPIILCKNCAIEYEFEIERRIKLSKKEKKRLKKLKLNHIKNLLNGKKENNKEGRNVLS